MRCAGALIGDLGVDTREDSVLPEWVLADRPLFRIGKVRIKREHRDFIDEWINYDASLSRPKDVCLDSVEIALRCAGALIGDLGVDTREDSVLPEWVLADRPGRSRREDFVDETPSFLYPDEWWSC